MSRAEVVVETVVVPDGCEAIAIAGGPYSNFGSVAAFLERTSAIDHRFCLGDIGGFGPLPDRTLDLIRDAQLDCVQGNYDHSIGHGESDCGCGYIDPMDRHYAQVSYDYTFANTGERHKAWLRSLPAQIIVEWRSRRLLLCHGSPDQVNEFVWESETGDRRIDAWLTQYDVDGICATHSGLPWIRTTERGFWFNVGVLGRPAHEDSARVFYGVIDFPGDTPQLQPRLIPLDYDPSPVAAAMRSEGLPDVFVDSLLRGRWTTCCNILPDAERTPRSRFDGDNVDIARNGVCDGAAVRARMAVSPSRIGADARLHGRMLDAEAVAGK